MRRRILRIEPRRRLERAEGPDIVTQGCVDLAFDQCSFCTLRIRRRGRLRGAKGGVEPLLGLKEPRLEQESGNAERIPFQHRAKRRVRGIAPIAPRVLHGCEPHAGAVAGWLAGDQVI